MRAARGLRQLRSSSDKRQPLAQSSSDATVGSGAASSVHDSWNSMAKASTEDSAQVISMSCTRPAYTCHVIILIMYTAQLS